MPTPSNDNNQFRILVEPGALDDVPLVELAQFLATYRKELVYKPDGLTIRSRILPPATPEDH